MDSQIAHNPELMPYLIWICNNKEGEDYREQDIYLMVPDDRFATIVTCLRNFTAETGLYRGWSIVADADSGGVADDLLSYWP